MGLSEYLDLDEDELVELAFEDEDELGDAYLDYTVEQSPFTRFQTFRDWLIDRVNATSGPTLLYSIYAEADRRRVQNTNSQLTRTHVFAYVLHHTTLTEQVSVTGWPKRTATSWLKPDTAPTFVVELSDTGESALILRYEKMSRMQSPSGLRRVILAEIQMGDKREAFVSAVCDRLEALLATQ